MWFFRIACLEDAQIFFRESCCCTSAPLQFRRAGIRVWRERIIVNVEQRAITHQSNGADIPQPFDSARFTCCWTLCVSLSWLSLSRAQLSIIHCAPCTSFYSTQIKSLYMFVNCIHPEAINSGRAPAVLIALIAPTGFSIKMRRSQKYNAFCLFLLVPRYYGVLKLICSIIDFVYGGAKRGKWTQINLDECYNVAFKSHLRTIYPKTKTQNKAL